MPKINKSNPNNNNITFYVFHLPILLLIVGFLALSSFVTSKVLNKSESTKSPQKDIGYVLGNEDDENEAEDDNDEDEDKDEDENEDDENEEEDMDDDKDEEYENDNEEDSNENNKSTTQERVQNQDGTYSIIKTERDGNKVKIEIKTYNASGKLIKEEKHKGDDEGFESETESSIGNKLKVRVQNTEALIKREGLTGLNNFPLYLDENDGSVYVDTPKGEVKLGVMPQTVIEKAESSEDVDSIDEIELESEDDVEYSIKVKNDEKLFGLFRLEIPKTLYFDAQNGEQLRSEQSFISKILDFLSF